MKAISCSENDDQTFCQFVGRLGRTIRKTRGALHWRGYDWGHKKEKRTSEKMHDKDLNFLQVHNIAKLRAFFTLFLLNIHAKTTYSSTVFCLITYAILIYTNFTNTIKYV